MVDMESLINNGFCCHFIDQADNHILLDDIHNVAIIDAEPIELIILKGAYDHSKAIDEQEWVMIKGFQNEKDLNNFIRKGLKRMLEDLNKGNQNKKNSDSFLIDYFQTFSFPELEKIKSEDVDSDFNEALKKLTSVYATFDSPKEFSDYLNQKTKSLTEDNMLKAANENFKCI